jgi:hypothetical protein
MLMEREEGTLALLMRLGVLDDTAAEHTPQILDVTRRCLKKVQVRCREVDVVNLAVLNVLHALIDAQGQNAG